jgi:hypothetical protein
MKGMSKMVIVNLGNKKRKYKSIREAAEASGVPYMTLYMRLRFGTKAATAINKPVCAYRKAA